MNQQKLLQKYLTKPLALTGQYDKHIKATPGHWTAGKGKDE